MDLPSDREALQTALRKLKSGDRFESEIRAFLSDFSSEAVDDVITYLKGRRIIDDTRTIQNLVERYSGKRSIGTEKLRAELLERGAPEEIVDTVMASRIASESSKMLEVLSAKFTPAVSRAKAARFLYSRGFPDEEIESVLDRFFQP
ncbi:MAG: regulatory protein RecX [Fimbriimonas sp.]|nr:regulatory protein RecX [Fimbriimonas sp.]